MRPTRSDSARRSRLGLPVRLAAAVTLTSAAVALAAPTAAHAAQAPTLMGWTSQADANPFDFVVDNSAGLAGVHPLSEADVPEASSDFETGPFGHGLASVAWPGGTAGNLGSLSGEIGVPAQLAPLLAGANDPVRAETFYPAGPASATYPAGNPSGAGQMVSQATANGTSAASGLANFSVASLFTVTGVSGQSTATATDKAVSTATGGFSGLSILKGLITMGATTSTAIATSDGVSPTGTAVTHLGAITVDGHAVSIGSDGLVVGPATTNLLGVATAPTVAQVNQLISALHLSITPLPVAETRKAPVENITTGGLKLSLALPSEASVNLDCSALPPQASQLSVLCQLPGLLQGASLSVTLARATATAIATPPFSFNFNPGSLSGLGGTGLGTSGTGSSSSSPVAAIGGTGLGSGSGGGGAGTGGPSPAASQGPSLAGVPPSASPASSAPTSMAASARPTSLAALPTTPAAMSRPIKAGLLIALLLVATAAGAGLFRMGRHVDDAPTSTCPLEETA